MAKEPTSYRTDRTSPPIAGTAGWRYVTPVTITPRRSRDVCAAIAASRVWPIEVEGLEVAWSIEDRFGLSFWDSLIVAAAHVAGCEVILTEDLKHGMDFDGVRVVDPFRTSVADLH